MYATQERQNHDAVGELAADEIIEPAGVRKLDANHQQKKGNQARVTERM